MSVGRKTITIIAIICAVLVISLVSIDTGLFTDNSISPEEKTSNVKAVNVDLEVAATLPVEDAQAGDQVAGVLPAELEEVETVLSAIERDRASLESPELKDEIMKADAIIAEMDQLISQMDIEHTQPDDQEFSAVADEIEALQAQMLDVIADTE